MFLSFGQYGFIAKNRNFKKNLRTGECQLIISDVYQKIDTKYTKRQKRITSVRQYEFVLQSKEQNVKKGQTDASLNAPTFSVNIHNAEGAKSDKS